MRGAPQATTLRFGGITWRASDARPDRTSVRGEVSFSHEAADGRVLQFEGFTEIRSDSTHFHYRHERWVKEDGETVRRRRWQDIIPRYFQ